MGRNVRIKCPDSSDLAQCVWTLCNNFWWAEMLESDIYTVWTAKMGLDIGQ